MMVIKKRMRCADVMTARSAMGSEQCGVRKGMANNNYLLQVKGTGVHDEFYCSSLVLKLFGHPYNYLPFSIQRIYLYAYTCTTLS